MNNVCRECGSVLNSKIELITQYCDDCELMFKEEYYDSETDYDSDQYLIDGVGFANSDSALRAESENNPRIYECPTCNTPNVLTKIDFMRGYQCDDCANALEMGY